MMHAAPTTIIALEKALTSVMHELWPCIRPSAVLGWHGLTNVTAKDKYVATTPEAFRAAFVKHVAPVAPHLAAVVELHTLHLRGRDLDRFKSTWACRQMGLLLAFCEAARHESDENAHVLAGHIVELARMTDTIAAALMTELVFGGPAR